MIDASAGAISRGVGAPLAIGGGDDGKTGARREQAVPPFLRLFDLLRRSFEAPYTVAVLRALLRD